MVVAGATHTVLLRSSGEAFAIGGNEHGQCNIPLPCSGRHVVTLGAGRSHTVLLYSDGSADAIGNNEKGQCDIPQLPQGLSYVSVACGGAHTVLIRSDGQAVACGENDAQQCDIPLPPSGLHYVAAAAGFWHTVVIREDGNAIACGLNNFGQCKIPQLPLGTCYTAVAAGTFFTVLVRDDGKASACGLNNYGQLDIPVIPDGETAKYMKVAAGFFHTLLLRDDGEIATCGQNDEGQLAIPKPPVDITYVGIASGGMHSLLLASDGHAIAIGLNQNGQCDVQEPPAGLHYVVSLSPDAELDREPDVETYINPSQRLPSSPQELPRSFRHIEESLSENASRQTEQRHSEYDADDSEHSMNSERWQPTSCEVAFNQAACQHKLISELSDCDESVAEELEVPEQLLACDLESSCHPQSDVGDVESVPEELEDSPSPCRIIGVPHDSVSPLVACIEDEEREEDDVEERAHKTTGRNRTSSASWDSSCERESTATSVPTDDGT